MIPGASALTPADAIFPHQMVCLARTCASPGHVPRQEPWLARSRFCKKLLIAEIHGSPADMAPRSHGLPGAMACHGPRLARSHEAQVVGAGVGIVVSSIRYGSSSSCRVSLSGFPQWALRVHPEVLPQSGHRNECPQRALKYPLKCPLPVPTKLFVDNI